MDVYLQLIRQSLIIEIHNYKLDMKDDVYSFKCTVNTYQLNGMNNIQIIIPSP